MKAVCRKPTGLAARMKRAQLGGQPDAAAISGD